MSELYGFDGKVAIVTGAGGGLGKAYAKLLAGRGARVIVNDLGGAVDGIGQGNAMADLVVEEIKAAGGEAAPSYDSVEDGDKVVQAALDHFGQIDIVVNNAGILRDKSFHKMTAEDWAMTYRVHLFGSFQVTHAAWPHMRKNGYGRIVMATSSSGLYGNFGQANYGAMKMGLVGLANTLAIEGKKYNIGVNCFAPYGATRMTLDLLPDQMKEMTVPEKAAPLIGYLCHESFEGTGLVFEVGGGFMAQLRLQRSSGHLF
ncbi:MAG: SDR family oxidoreductase, partial [Chloroflexota bacterium]